MNLPVEFFQLSFFTERAPSALRLWSSQFPDRDPTNVETDDDGDTRARAKFDFGWIDIHRYGAGRIFLYASRSERTSTYDPLSHFEEAEFEAARSAMADLGAKIAATHECVRVGAAIQASQLFESAMGAMAALRSQHSTFLPPTRSIEARFDSVIPFQSELAPKLEMPQNVSYRVGRRGIRNPGGEYEAADGTSIDLHYALGHRVDVNTGDDEETIFEANVAAGLSVELADQALKLWKGGLDVL